MDALNGQTEAGDAGGRTLADLIFSKMEGGAVTQGVDDDEGGACFSMKVWRRKP